MTYDDIPHLSAKIKPKQQKVGCPLMEVEEGKGGVIWVGAGGREQMAPWGLEAQKKRIRGLRGEPIACRA